MCTSSIFVERDIPPGLIPGSPWQKRAESAVNYIVTNGIAQSRITAKGYGEEKLKNKCADGVKCSEDDHQANRRTEIMIVDF